MSELDILKGHAVNIRKNIVKMVTEAKSGHPGGSLSSVEIGVALYFTQMDINEENISSLNRDRFVLSKGHASIAVFTTCRKRVFKRRGIVDFP